MLFSLLIYPPHPCEKDSSCHLQKKGPLSNKIEKKTLDFQLATQQKKIWGGKWGVIKTHHWPSNYTLIGS